MCNEQQQHFLTATGDAVGDDDGGGSSSSSSSGSSSGNSCGLNFKYSNGS